MNEPDEIHINSPEIAAAYMIACDNGVEFDVKAFTKRHSTRTDSVQRTLKRMHTAGLINLNAKDPADQILKHTRAALETRHGDILATEQALFQADQKSNETGAGAVQLITLDRLHESELNPRKKFDPQAIEDLALDILENGVLQNPVARPHPGKPGHFELAAGATRLRAMTLLAERALSSPKFNPTLPVSVLVRDMSDADMLLVGISENRQRTDVHPLDEGEAFLRLKHLRQSEHADTPQADRIAGKITEELAEAVGKSRKFVQDRIKLANNLAPAVRDAFRQDQISRTQARAFASQTDHAIQEAVLSNVINWGAARYSEREILNLVHEAGFVYYKDREGVIFSLNDYKGDKIELSAETAAEAGHDTDNPVFILSNPAEAKTLQMAALEVLVERQSSKRAFADIAPDRNAYWWTYNDAKGGSSKETGIVYLLDSNGLVASRSPVSREKPSKKTTEPDKKQAEADALKDAAQTDGLSSSPEPYRRRHWLNSKQVKTKALQAALASSDPAPTMALALLSTLDWFGGECRAIRLHTTRLTGEDTNIGKGGMLYNALTTTAPKGAKPVRGLKLDEKRAQVIVTAPNPAFTDLVKRDDLAALFAAAIADQFGTWAGPYGDNPAAGDSPLVLSVAEHLGAETLTAHMPAPNLSYFEMFSTGSLIRIAQSMGKDPSAIPQKKSEAAGWVHMRSEGYHPPERTFADADTLNAAAQALMSGTAT